jgi:hypothetical protein
MENNCRSKIAHTIDTASQTNAVTDKPYKAKYVQTDTLAMKDTFTPGYRSLPWHSLFG